MTVVRLVGIYSHDAARRVQEGKNPRIQAAGISQCLRDGFLIVTSIEGLCYNFLVS